MCIVTKHFKLLKITLRLQIENERQEEKKVQKFVLINGTNRKNQTNSIYGK